MTQGALLFYGGMAGFAIAALALLICMVVFPRKRKKKLEKLSGG